MVNRVGNYGMGWLPDYPDFRDYTEKTSKIQEVLGLRKPSKTKNPPVSMDLRNGVHLSKTRGTSARALPMQG